MSYINELAITPEVIHEYCKAHTTPPSAVLQELILATRQESNQWVMQVGHLEGRFLSMITKLMNAQSVLEFGTFTGYSALSFAEALPENGRVTTLDRDPTATSLAQKFWNKSEHGKKIELILGDARETVKKLNDDIMSGVRKKYDVAFIDADKAGYKDYWEASLMLVRRGGAIIVDNTLWSGRVINPTEKSDFEIASFNTLAKNDARVQTSLLPIRDGILLAYIL